MKQIYLLILLYGISTPTICGAEKREPIEQRHKREIAMYEQTITALMAERDAKDREINRLKEIYKLKMLKEEITDAEINRLEYYDKIR